MSVTMEDYHKAVEGFIHDLEAFGDDLVSVSIYGSCARGNISPGKSDVGDAYVFLRQRVLEDRESFLHALDRMVDAYGNLTRTGLPSHAYHYFGDEELRYIPAPFFATLLSGKESRLVAGVDMGARCRDTVPVENGNTDVLHSYVYPLARFLAREELTPEERASLVTRLDHIRKYGPASACAASGAPAAGEDALRTLARLFPDLDLSVLDDVAGLRKMGDELPGSEELKGLLRRCFILMEGVHRKITTRKVSPA